MGADASIYSQFLRPVRSVTDYSADMDQADMRRLQIQGQLGQNALLDVTRQGQAQAAQSAMEDRNALQRVASSWAPTTTVAERAAALRSTGRPALFTIADQLETQDGTKRKTAADIGKTEAETAAKALEVRVQKYETAIRDIAAFDTPQQAMQALQAHAQAGDIDPQRAQMVAQTIPQDPAKFGAWQLGMLRRIMAAKDQMSYVQPDANTVANNATSVKNNAATVGATVRGQNLTDARARDGLAQTERLSNRGTVQMTNDGLFVVDPRTGKGRQVTNSATGEALGPRLKDIPASANTAIITNAQNLQRAQQALALIQGKKVGVMAGDKEATGWKGYLPGQVLNRVDPSGVDARAAIADLGSLIIHDRSGAAVTAAEFPRLAPFIPRASDDAATVEKKLQRFVQVFGDEQRALNDTYSKEQGYRPSPVASGSTAPGVPPDVAALLEKHGGR